MSIPVYKHPDAVEFVHKEHTLLLVARGSFSVRVLGYRIDNTQVDMTATVSHFCKGTAQWSVKEMNPGCYLEDSRIRDYLADEVVKIIEFDNRRILERDTLMLMNHPSN